MTKAKRDPVRLPGHEPAQRASHGPTRSGPRQPGPTRSGPRQRQAVRSVRAALVLGCLLLLAAGCLLAFGGPAAQREERDFRAAAACPASGGDDCLRTVPAKIDGAEHEEGRRSARYWLHLTEDDGTERSPYFDGRPPAAAKAGAPVRVTHWRGEIRYVDFPGHRAYTREDPRDGHRPYYAAGFGLALWSPSFLWGSYWWARRRHVSPKAFPWQINLPIVGATLLAAVGAVAPLTTGSVPFALRIVGIGAVPIVAGCALVALVLWMRRNRDDTLAPRPELPPAKGKVVLGRVLGDVPYATDGGHLALAPGKLATTPDPTGSFAAREVPRTLTLLRVRPAYWTDPAERPDFDGRAVVLECADGDTPVLITTHRKHMPLVLGALLPNVPTGRRAEPEPADPRP